MEVVSGNTESSKTMQIPIAMDNLLFQVNCVLRSDIHMAVISVAEKEALERFIGTNQEAQLLFTRIYGRTLEYYEENDLIMRYGKDFDVSTALDELLSKRFCQVVHFPSLIIHETDFHTFNLQIVQNIGIEDKLKRLTTLKLKGICDSLGVKKKSSTKGSLIAAIKKEIDIEGRTGEKRKRSGKTQRTLFGGVVSPAKRVNSMLGRYIKPEVEWTELLQRLAIIMHLDAFDGNLALQRLSIRQFPAVKVKISRCIFESRYELLMYQKALQLEQYLEGDVEAQAIRAFVMALARLERSSDGIASRLAEELESIYGHKLEADLDDLLSQNSLDALKSDVARHHSSEEVPKPLFLQRYTAEHVYTRLCHHGLPMLQSLKLYSFEIEILKLLLSRSTAPGRRGYWYSRLALDLSYHNGQHSEALEVCNSALEEAEMLAEDEIVSIQEKADRLAAKMRKIQSKKDNAGKKVENMTSSEELREVAAPEDLLLEKYERLKPNFFQLKEFNVKVLPALKYVNENGGRGGRVAYQSGFGTKLNVEEYAKEQYILTEHWENGIHCESMLWRTLFALFFYDAIYHSDVPDVFQSTCQTTPLDILVGHEFYANRKTILEDRMALLSNYARDEVVGELRRVWEEHEGETIMAVDWERYGIELLEEIVRCIQPAKLVGILCKLAENFRFWGAGMPDLVLWSTMREDIKLVEVKSKADRLSNKQRCWISHMITIGVDVEVCHFAREELVEEVEEE